MLCSREYIMFQGSRGSTQKMGRQLILAGQNLVQLVLVKRCSSNPLLCHV